MPAPSGTDTGQIKMFDPSQMMNNNANQPSVQLFNGQPETSNDQSQDYQQTQNGMVHNQNFQGQYYQNTDSQMNYGYQGQQFDPGQGQQFDPSQGQQFDHNQGQQFDLNQGQQFDPNQGQQFDQNQQYYWDPSQQMWLPQVPYQDYGQQWSNSDYQQPTQNSLNVNAEQFVPNYQQPGYDASQGQGFMTQDIGQGHTENDSLDLSQTSEGSTSFSQSNDTSGLGGLYHDGESSLSNSCANSIQDEKAQSQNLPHHVEQNDHIRTEISNESLSTVQFSSAGDVRDSIPNTEVSSLTGQMQGVSLYDNNNAESVGNDNTIQRTVGEQPPSFNVQHGSQEGGVVPESSPGGSQNSEGLSDWEVVPPHNLAVPGQQSEGSTHSREGSIDNNVQFFIGSSRNSEEGGTPESFMQVKLI